MAIAPSSKLSLFLDFLGLGLQAAALKTNFEILDSAVGKVLTGTKTQDFPSVADGAQSTTTVTVTGAALGDFVTGVSLDVSQAGVILTAYVSAADTVTVVFQNETGGAVDLSLAVLRVLVRKA